MVKIVATNLEFLVETERVLQLLLLVTKFYLFLASVGACRASSHRALLPLLFVGCSLLLCSPERTTRSAYEVRLRGRAVNNIWKSLYGDKASLRVITILHVRGAAFPRRSRISLLSIVRMVVLRPTTTTSFLPFTEPVRRGPATQRGLSFFTRHRPGRK